MNIDFPLLKKLCETPGAPGREERVRELLIEELEPLCDEVTTDPVGNVVGFKKGSEGGKLLISAHMDEIAFMVSFIDDEGFLRFLPLGGFDPKTLSAQRVIVHGREDLLGVMGTKPIHIMTPEERTKAPKLEDFYIDLGLPVDKVKELVRPGNVVTRERTIEPLGDLINGKSFDNRVGVFVMLEGLRAAKSSRMDVYVVGSVQEEVGLRGATVAAQRIQPDVGIGVDTTLANDVPGVSAHEQITKLGQGVGVKVLDGSVICNHKVVTHMETICDDREIPWQAEVLPKGGTDTGALQRNGGGSAVGAISVPTRYIHSVIETMHPNDVKAAVDLCAAFIETAGKDDFKL